MPADSLLLSRLRFHAHHGMLPAESAHGQIFEVSVRLEFPLAPAGTSDDLAKTVDYQDVYVSVGKILQGPRVKLVETLAEQVAAELLASYKIVEAVEVEIMKAAPPVGFACGGLGVKIRRQRN